MAHVRWTARPALRTPVVIAAFEGWNDAGDAATTAARYLADRWDLDEVGDVDPEEFYDFTSTRPQVQLDDDGRREIIWPTTDIFAGTIPGGDEDVVLIVGTEPQLRWRTYCAELTEIATGQQARLCLTLGALLAEVPHTRPTSIVGTAYEPDVVAGLDLRPSTYEGPTGIVGVLHDAWRQAGLRSASLWATVPSYVPGAPSPKAALALIERTATMLQTWVPTTDLEIASAAYERQVSELVDADEETSTYVTSLEERHDEDPGIVPSAESIAEEVERFLRDQ
jgi:predicted ATP-grasp superfamily ATP-dependent carboligase